MCEAAGRKRISAVWKLQIFHRSDSDLDPFLAKNAKSAKQLGRFSRRFHLRPFATSAVENSASTAWKFRIFHHRRTQGSKAATQILRSD
jgi:hypothetical protein